MGCSASTHMSTASSTLPTTDQLSVKQKAVIRSTWKKIASDLSGRAAMVFLRIFELHPEIKNLFPCRDLEGETLINDHHFKGHASRFMQAVGAAVDNLDDMSVLSPLLVGLGKRHINFKGFRPKYWDAFIESILFIFRQELGFRFSTDARDSWQAVLNFIIIKLNEGYNDALRERLDVDGNLLNNSVGIDQNGYLDSNTNGGASAGGNKEKEEEGEEKGDKKTGGSNGRKGVGISGIGRKNLEFGNVGKTYGLISA